MEDEKIMKDIQEKYHKNFSFVSSQLLDSLHYLINNPPTYTIINTARLNKDIVSFIFVSNIFNKTYPVTDRFQNYIEQKLTDGNNILDFLNDPANAKKDIEWTNKHNEGFEYELYVKYDYTTELQKKIVTLLKEIDTDLLIFQKAFYNVQDKRMAKREGRK